MPSVGCFRLFVRERLTAAAEEIFKVFEETLIEYEEEISRQRSPVEPGVKSILTELSQQQVCKAERKEDDHSDQKLCNQERNCFLKPDPPQIKDEQEELCISQDREQLVLKQEPDVVMLTIAYDDDDHSEDESLHFVPEETQSATEKELVDNVPCKNSEVAEPDSNHKLLPHSTHSANSCDHSEETHGDSEPTTTTETNPHHTNMTQSVSAVNYAMLNMPCNSDTGKKSLKCDTCGKIFKDNYNFIRHQRMHTGEKPYSCNFCGKGFSQKSAMTIHKRMHTGEKPYSCIICGKSFGNSTVLKVHKRIHTGEKPYSCKFCVSKFTDLSALNRHMRTHTGEKLYSCSICANRFADTASLKKHMRIHTGEKPYLCATCGQSFCQWSHWKKHTRTHTSEVSLSCKVCGKDFRSRGGLSVHLRTHTDTMPYQCDTCGKGYFVASHYQKHIASHKGE
ncbi:zinc finger protein OZF-like [Parambassis ranga]|uniref:Zinc finger protein OZF-like n=1 Tax=Parambassis ranga TaxID=210632 RepID=A0A6P7J1C5_9TELE|nr:zinc finger protein OZF-like [Parambassis ranga]